jgi:putative phage-type endonuclease
MDIANKLIKQNKAGLFPKQRTKEWVDIRKNMITATNVSSILDCNIYTSSYDLMIQKLSDKQSGSNDSMEWGNMFEDIAIKFYEFTYNEKSNEIGLVSHKKYPWLGASPDGVVSSGKLLEIKCPKFRTIGVIPHYYWIQMQIQMEVCNMPSCDYLECKFYRYISKNAYDDDDITTKYSFQNNNETVYYKFIKSYKELVYRDKQWFNNNISQIEEFYKTMIKYKNMDNGIDQFKQSVKNNSRKKRMKNKRNNTSRKRHYNEMVFTKWDNWVSATKIHNYMIDDPIIDYLEIYKHKNANVSIDTFSKVIMEKGNLFEKRIIKQIKDKFPRSFVEVGNSQNIRSHAMYLKTIDYMNKGIPIIYHGILHDHSKKIYGSPDIIIRSDWLNKLFNKPVETYANVSNNLNKHNYLIMEIKHISMTLCADGMHLRNSNKNILAYKGQLYIYNKMLEHIQGFTPNRAYIIGKKWDYTSGKIHHRGSTFDLPAIVNFADKDIDIRTKTYHAIKWIRDLRNNGDCMQLSPPSREELKPNMCSPNDRWNNIKKELACRNNEITELWMCSIHHRNIARKNNITNWREHSGLVSEMLGVNGLKTAPTLQLIIDLNQNTEITEPFMPLEQVGDEWLSFPKKIKTNMFKWKKNNFDELYVDFETIVSDVIENNDITRTFVFMIGVCQIVNNKLKYTVFIANTIDQSEEERIFNEFHDYINSLKKPINVYHWGHIEQSIYRDIICRYKLPKLNNTLTWCDLLKLFKQEPIVFRGMLNFSLKSVVKAMYKLKYIKTQYNSDIIDGMTAMVLAYNEYIKNNNVLQSDIMNKIVYYNKIDCTVLYDILSYLRCYKK